MPACMHDAWRDPAWTGYMGNRSRPAIGQGQAHRAHAEPGVPAPADALRRARPECDGAAGAGGGMPMANTICSAPKSAMQSLLKHTKNSPIHRKLLANIASKSRAAFDLGLLERRINRTLMDPRTGKKLSNMRPDFFAFDGKGLVVLGEACNTQNPEEARKKLRIMADLYAKLGFRVELLLTTASGTEHFQ
jgi:hypothetical protein